MYSANTERLTDCVSQLKHKTSKSGVLLFQMWQGPSLRAEGPLPVAEFLPLPAAPGSAPRHQHAAMGAPCPTALKTPLISTEAASSPSPAAPGTDRGHPGGHRASGQGGGAQRGGARRPPRPILGDAGMFTGLTGTTRGGEQLGVRAARQELR